MTPITAMTGRAHIIRGNALALPLPDASVDLVVTSPPYFGLRSYTDQGEHYAGQIGSEATPAEFVDALLAATREMVRVLKPAGSIFVNLGDKYAGGGGYKPDSPANAGSNKHNTMTTYRKNGRDFGMTPKSLMGIPWRYALACIDQLGLILRAEIIWAKPNGLPESVTDRVRRSHEVWFHFVRSPRYFSAVDEIREEHAYPDWKRAHPRNEASSKYDSAASGHKNGTDNPLGKLPGSVWTIPTQPLTVPPELGVDHFAAYPMELPRRIIAGWSPSGICTVCGEGRRPITVSTRMFAGQPITSPDFVESRKATRRATGFDNNLYTTDRAISGYACACPDATTPTRPSTILDPFGGTGTTALVADVMGRTGISVDMSMDYSRLAQWRVNDPGQRAAAAQVEKPDPVHPDQLDLFSEVPA